MSKRRVLFFGAVIIAVTAGAVLAQYTPWLYWTLLPKAQMDEIVGEASGETAWATIADINAYNRQRNDAEYAGNFLETQVIAGKLKQYGLAGVDIVTYPAGEAWRPLRGDLWEVAPNRQKLASINDMLPMLASGSVDTDVTAELIWVGRGTPKEVQEAKVSGKIVVLEGNMMMAYSEAMRQGALGVVAISQSRTTFDPLQMPWSGISMRSMMGGMRGGRQAAGQQQAGQQPAGQQQAGQQPAGQPAAKPQAPLQPPPAKFGFQLPLREGEALKRRLLQNEKITVRAQVKAKMETVDLENVTCHIPGTDPKAGEVIFSAHLFEGFSKQGANDNISGSATILECARLLNTLIGEGRLPRPRRTIRFIWGPEFSGIGQWVKANRELMKSTLCNINMDMVGEWLSKNQAFFCLMRTTYGHSHYINDVMENYYRYVGEGNRERIQNRGSAGRAVPVRIVAPFGADEPFYYSIETHYGASDHEVFNDWGVQVPGIMMIAWPDKWYHTSGDLADKSDPTQLKRAAIIGAAGAYTVAGADLDMAVKIASETASNATRRLGHQLAVGLETLNAATKETLAQAHKDAVWSLEAAVSNEVDTLTSVLELAPGDGVIVAHVGQLKKSVANVGAAQLAALQTHMSAVAGRLGVKPVQVVLTDLEKRAAKVVPSPTAKVTQDGYNEYRKFIDQVPREERNKYPYVTSAGGNEDLRLGDAAELHRLINGRHSVLDIKKMLDAQSQRRAGLQGILNYLQVLKLAGLVEM
ncbi:MAG: M28 family peptidase [Candidatus Aminicenantes bacterium]|nr:M28 family peptidase [Candidatus Aminicenantes bacterium]